MINGHGDDIYRYPDIRINFSSNVYNHFSHDGLFRHLQSAMESIRNYPDPSADVLKSELATKLALHADEVLVTNGATDAIYLVAQAFRGVSSGILVPTFSEYADACRLHGQNVYEFTSLSEINSMLDVVWLCNPNNPTGSVIAKSELISLIDKHPNIVFVVDASYADFSPEPCLSSSDACKLGNVILLHSMTKEYAIPGLRLGYVTGNAGLLTRIRSYMLPWSVNALAQEAGLYLLRHKCDYVLPVSQLVKERERVAAAFHDMGIYTFPSDTHMLLCRLPGIVASHVKDVLARNHGILIRNASNFSGLDEFCFRVAVQLPEENDELIYAISETIS